MGSLLLPVFVVVSVVLLVGTPGYVIAQRRGLSNPWIAFVPMVGLLIILCESAGQRGWIAVAAIIPFVGTVIWLWLAFAIPPAHGRRRWWTLASGYVTWGHLCGYGSHGQLGARAGIEKSWNQTPRKNGL